VSKGFNIPVIQLNNYDSDAVIYTYTNEAVKAGHQVSLVTEDLRLFQLLSHKDRVTAWTPKKPKKTGNFLDEDEVRSRYGVTPALLRDWHVLTGSNRFGLPGIEGFKGTHAHTHKIATAFLNMYGNLEHVLSNLDNLKAKAPQYYEYIKPNVDLIKSGLATYTLHPAPVEVDFNKLRYDKLNTDFLIPKLHEYDFKTVLQKLPVLGIPQAEIDKYNITSPPVDQKAAQ